MKRLSETHGSTFELLRHFLARMFDSELSSARGQWMTVAVSAFALLLPAGLLLLRQGAEKQGRSVVPPDQLALLTLVSAITGLVAVLQWQALFPSRRDYLALASLPVRSRDIFLARFAAALLFSIALIAAMIPLPSVIAPAAFDGPYLTGALAEAATLSSACLFIFFSIIAIQGLLLNVLPPRIFARISVYVQGALTALLLLAALLTGSIQDQPQPTTADLWNFGRWMPPAWFAGLHETLLGARDPFIQALAHRAMAGLGMVAALTGLTYLLSYRRARRLLIEAPFPAAPQRGERRSLLALLARTPRQAAILHFMAAAVARSRIHRMVLLGYTGAALGILLNSSLVAGAALRWSVGWKEALQFAFLFWPLGLSAILLPGFRHAFSIPVELGANWVFQITESHGRSEWMSAVSRFILVFAIAPIYVLMLPIGVLAVGWETALRVVVLQLLVSLSIREIQFYSWQQLPFTCSYRPGKRPLSAVAASYLAVLFVIVPLLARLIASVSQMPEIFFAYVPIFVVVWIWLRKQRLEGWGSSQLLYEDRAEAVPDLGIRDLRYGGAAERQVG